MRVCIRTSQSKNPTKRYSLASKRKWMSRAWPNPREKNMTSTTPRCRNWKSCRNRGGQEFRGRSGAGGGPEGGKQWQSWPNQLVVGGWFSNFKSRQGLPRGFGGGFLAAKSKR